MSGKNSPQINGFETQCRVSQLISMTCPASRSGRMRLNLSTNEKAGLDAEITEFKKFNIVEPCPADEPDSFYGNLFVRTKRDGSLRVIFNLKQLTPHLEKHHYTPTQRSWKGGILEWDCPSVRLYPTVPVNALPGAILLRSRLDLVGTHLGARSQTSSFVGDPAR